MACITKQIFQILDTDILVLKFSYTSILHSFNFIYYREGYNSDMENSQGGGRGRGSMRGRGRGRGNRNDARFNSGNSVILKLLQEKKSNKN